MDAATSGSRVGRWAVPFLLVAVCVGCWLLAMPISSAPDEPAHLLRAASVAAGQLLGEPISDDPSEPQLRVRVADDVLGAIPEPACYAFKAGEAADCAGAPSAGTATPGPTDLAVTTSGRHPPAYYALVALPLMVGGGPYAARALAALVCTMFFAAALGIAATSPAPRATVAGVLAAITPMTLYLAGVVNPSNLEIAAALALWVALLTLARRPLPADGDLSRPLLAGAGLAGVVLTLTRPVSALWLVLAVGTAALVARPGVLRALLRDRVVWAWAGAGAAAGLASVGWLLVVGNPILESPFPVPPPVSLPTALRLTLQRTSINVEHMIGMFGWLDTPLPAWVRVLWLAGIAGLVAAAVASRRRRHALVLAALIVATVFVPALLEAVRYNDLGIIWQGRYTLPLAAGIPILAALTAAEGAPAVRRVVQRLAVPLATLFAVLHVVGFVVALQRYSVGLTAPLLTTFTAPAWTPPVPAVLLVAVFAAAQAGLVWWCATAQGSGETPAPAAEQPVAAVAAEPPR